MQRHLNDSRATDRVLNEACPGGARSGSKRARVANGWDRSEPLAREPARRSLHVRTEARIQAHVVIRHVKTGVVKNVEELRIVAQGKALVELEGLGRTEVKPHLKWSPVNVAPHIGETRFRKVAGGGGIVRLAGCRTARRHTVGSRRVYEHAELADVEDGVRGIYARSALKLRSLGIRARCAE